MSHTEHIMTKIEQEWPDSGNSVAKSERQFREMMDALPAAIYITDAEGRLTYFNPAAAEFSGRKPKLGTDQWCVTWKLYHSDGTLMPHEECPMATALKEGRSISGEVAIAERPDGKRIWFEPYPSPLYDDEGKIIGGINMLVDITEEHERTDWLQEEQKKLLELITSGTPLNECLSALCSAVPRLNPGVRASILLADGQGRKFNRPIAPDLLPSFGDGLEGVPINDLMIGTCGEAVYRGRPVMCPDITSDERWSKEWRDLCVANGVLAGHSTPIRDVEGQALGSFFLCFSEPREPNEWEYRLAEFGTHIASIALERDRANRALRESKDKYRTLFESMDEGYCIAEVLFDEHEKPVDYRFLKVNPAFEKQTGLKDAEGKRMRELAPDHEEHWFEIYGKVALTGESVRFEQSAEALNRFYNVYAFPFGEPESRKVAILFNDVTERRKRDRTGALLGAIVSGSDDAIVSKNLNSIITSWNAGAERMFGYTAEEAVGQPVTMLIPEDRMDEEDHILEKIKRGENVDHLETVRISKDGTLLDVSLTISPVRNAEGQIIGASKIARDITKQKRTEKELQAMNETLEERVEERTAALLSYQDQLRALAFELSKAEEHEREHLATDLHDNLGQMLAVGKMKLDLLQLQKSGLPERTASGITELAGLMDDAIKYTRQLMSDLKPPPSLDKEDLSVSIGWVADKMKKHDLDVTMDDDGQPKPLGEEVRTTLRQCVRELLFNVVKHAGVNEAHVTLSRLGDQVQVAVEDEGRGFDLKEEKPAPTDKGGFGLFNIHERMDLLGGSLEVISEPGKGAKMILRAPVAEKEVRETRKVKEVKEAREVNPIVRVLLADDHQMVRKGLRKMIEEQDDLTVIAEAPNGEEAVKLAHETSPDIIVMDINMPGMNGIEATRKIIADAPHMRIIGLSLQEEESVARAMRSAGASAYLTKSEVFETLCATIRSEALAVRE